MKKVILYSIGNSIYCSETRELLKRYKIVFEEKRIDLDPKAMEELTKLSPENGAPVLVINGKVYHHFDEEELKKIFKKE